MPPLLARLRLHAPPVSPAQFVGWQPGCWVQYYDDTPAADPAKALSARAFDLALARRKQLDRCAVGFSLQAFGRARTAGELLVYRNLGVDVDLVSSEEPVVPVVEADRRKGEYLSARLVPFPLKPHWLVETRRGFHAVFRVTPVREPPLVAAAHALNRRLVRALGGDDRAALLTQVLRVPGTLQFKDPARPFLCRLLVDASARTPPYPLARVRAVLDAWEVFHAPNAADRPNDRPVPAWRAGLGGVPAGARNATAASLAGRIIARLPDELWEVAGWGGLKEWNARNASPLPERELRAVFESIARRERASRPSRGTGYFRPPAP